MDIKIKINTERMIEEAESKIHDEAKRCVRGIVMNFFGSNRIPRHNHTTNKLEYVIEKGEGVKYVEDIIANKFLDEKFLADLDRYFDQNWEEIFKVCMKKALQHKANGIAFNKVHKL